MANERVDGGVTTVFLLDLLISLSAEVEEDAANSANNSNHGNYNTTHNTANIGLLFTRRIGLGCGFCRS